jgi:SAM-dependent methyltransferase
MGFTQRRQTVEQRLSAAGSLHRLSLARFRLEARLASSINAVVRGRCLDCGAGRSPYAPLLAATADRVTVVDIEDRSGHVDVIADIQDMPQLGNASFDSVLCTQVLEHVPEPARAMAELSRVLVPGGHLIVSVPHLSAIHEAPNDFFRYTRYGLESLCRGAGLEVVDVSATAGLVAFLAHGASVGLMTSLGAVPGLFHPTRLFNELILIRLAGVIDRIIGLPGRYPCDYVLVARKRVAA